MPLLLFGRLRNDIVRHEEVDHLAGKLLKYLLGKLDSVAAEFLKRYELDDVTRHLSVEGVRKERLIVRIEQIHGAEVRVTDADNDDRKWEV